MKYQPLTHRYAEWLLPLIDLYDWGTYSKRFKEPRPAATTARLNVYYQQLTHPPQRLTRTPLELHLCRKDKLYYTSSRKSGLCLVCVDIDAHKGQRDALELSSWIRDRYFPGAYLEPSTRGYHLYLVVRVGFCKRSLFNGKLGSLQEDLSVVAVENGFKSMVEVLGRFSLVEEQEIINRAKLSPLPLLPNRESDMAVIEAMPIFPASVFEAVSSEADIVREGGCDVHDKHTSASKGRLGQHRNSACSWERMQWACFDYTSCYRSLPNVDQLLSYYVDIYDAGAADQDRIGRATRAIKYRAKTFDESKAQESGYEIQRQLLVEAVKSHCIDRSTKYHAQIIDEDLSIALYTIQRNSFRIYDDPRQQWSIPNAVISSMFIALKKAKLTTRGCSNLNKCVALKTILERARLIECVDLQYVHGDHWGVGKKYTIGPSHWRYHQFLKWSQPIHLLLVRDLESSVLPAAMIYDPSTAEEEIARILNLPVAA